MLSHQIENIFQYQMICQRSIWALASISTESVFELYICNAVNIILPKHILICITYSFLHETLDNLGAQLLWWHVPWRIISLLDAVAARHYLQTSSIFCSATQDCFGSSCTISIYMAQLIISSAKFTQLSTLLPHDFNQETPAKVDSSRARAIVVVPLRFPHRQNLCNRPPSAGEDSTTLHLTNCISR